MWKFWKSIKHFLKWLWVEKIRFLELHYIYFTLLIFITSAFYYFQPDNKWSYVDALFTATSGATNTGLNVIRMSDMSTYQVLVLYFTSFLGSHVTISLIILYIRKHFFSIRFDDMIKFNRQRQREERNKRRFERSILDLERGVKKEYRERAMTAMPGLKRRMSIFTPNITELENEKAANEQAKLGRHRSCSVDFNVSSPPSKKVQDQLDKFKKTRDKYLDAHKKRRMSLAPETLNTPNDEDSNRTRNSRGTSDSAMAIMKPRSLNINTTPNNNLDHQLTREQRYKIGGAEYRAIDMLTRLVPLYYIGFIIGFGFIFRIYIAASAYARNVLETSNGNGPVNPWLFSFFLSISAFNNLGLSLVDASMVPFQNAPFPLIMAAFLVLIGNTAYALMLRFIIWSFKKCTPPSYVMLRETLHYLLEHPRRCYTTLFPATQTRWLLLVLIAITVAEIGSFLALNYWLPVLNGIPWASRVLDGIFQSIATRSAGFSVVSLIDLNPGTQLVYIIAMYISVYPVAISMRNSNVYQERALGIFHHEQEDQEGENEEYKPETFSKIIKLDRHPTINSVLTNSRKVIRSPDFFVMTQIQRQLTNEICWLIAGVFLVCVIESGPIMDPSPITFLTILYECVSAFGNVGASVGFPGTTPSQSAEYRTLSKLVIMVLMYRGRHRGLPAAIDRAVLLPSEQMEENEIKEQEMKRRNTVLSQGIGANHFVYNRQKTN
ncbi:hypothetical protein PHYBLDRAFT_114125 [Phycomyces blakesleeanus NRRL 1555(-)]|uniref:Potassium transport protein n=1 Tax=Phycomyces blakesleeanus (strain ATCC 8743b / DSM 1359 / FGSC 10004 / NBRC 33097 / NRRL 1555) TaxID=763407 RepID=A0A162N898_PHYB8|nr:hypothetical protein PHYBLDRAFT_114125 [Phycomyces blakesleeanus NRRL 1555(-)]OAD72028.1 hypothetical protein PHYBLDRAFT_114125 [Phycomyces blakesleeanus NRRL 1555(-)]|eukprot:XP_018290068.1 hypothetical protein PHYBLDRAFT_114125 [Phycomyces blakesleeanus NRRL 1555(-)]